MREKYVLCFEREEDGRWCCEGFLHREDKGISSALAYGASPEQALENILYGLDWYVSGKEAGGHSEENPPAKLPVRL